MTESLQAELTALHELVERLGELAPPRAQPRDRLSAYRRDELTGRRALVIAPDVAPTACAFAAGGAARVLGCEPFGAQAPAAEGIVPESVELRSDWRSLDPGRDGTFDIVHCDGLLHRVPEPIALLRRLHELTDEGGFLVIGSMLLDDPERSELLRFVPDRHAGDPSWWFVPGRLAFRWMVMTTGFEIHAELAGHEGPRDGFAVAHGYLRAAPIVKTSAGPVPGGGSA